MHVLPRGVVENLNLGSMNGVLLVLAHQLIDLQGYFWPLLLLQGGWRSFDRWYKVLDKTSQDGVAVEIGLDGWAGCKTCMRRYSFA